MGSRGYGGVGKVAAVACRCGGPEIALLEYGISDTREFGRRRHFPISGREVQGGRSRTQVPASRPTFVMSLFISMLHGTKRAKYHWQTVAPQRSILVHTLR